MSLLTPKEREILIQTGKDQDMSFMFGDGMEEQYVMEGFPEHKGLLNMTDEELLRHVGHYKPGASVEEMLAEWKEELREMELLENED